MVAIVNREIVALNRRAKAHWDAINARMLACLSDLVTARIAASIAADDMKTEPFAKWAPYHQHVERAHCYAQIAISTRAERAGRVKKQDALQAVIVALVRKTPGLDLPGLLRRLETFGDPIASVTDDEIEYCHKGQIKTAKISALKDRLTRARKTVKLEKSHSR